MTLAQKYRVEFATQSSDRLMLYAAIAVVLHFGGIVVGLHLVRWLLPPNLAEPPDEPVPIEFVYLEEPTPAAPPPEAEPIAAVNSRAQSSEPRKAEATAIPNEGKAAPEVEIAPAQKDIDATPGGAIVPTVAPLPSQSKALEPPPSSSKPRTVPAVPAFPSPTPSAPSPAPTQPAAAAPPEIPAQPAPAARLPQPPDRYAAPAAESPATPAAPSPEPESPATNPPVAPAAPDAVDIPVTPPAATPGEAAVSDRGQGLAGTATPTTAAPSDEMAIAAQQAALGEYQQQVEAQLNAQWNSVPVTTRQQAVVRFTVDRAGQLVAIDLKEAAAQADVNQAALAAVQAAAPFAPLPAAYPADQLVINYAFISEVAAPSPTSN